jgi:hypothetical protein
MKVVSGQFDSSDFSRPPTHGVYSQAAWELLSEKAYPISLHWSYDAAVDAAARDEMTGHEQVLVRYAKDGIRASNLISGSANG